jgi:hypothetical protein
MIKNPRLLCSVLLLLILSFNLNGQNRFLDDIELSYQPIGLPLKVSIGTSGIKLAFEPSIVTPIGTFSLGFTKNLTDRNQPVRIVDRTTFIERDLVLILRNSRAGKDYYFKVKNGNYFNLVSNGTTRITYKQNMLIIDLNDADNYELGFYENNYRQESFTFVEKKEVQIISNPEKAEVYLDNVYIGYTPCNLILTKGSHKILLEKENYRNFEETINISEKNSYNFGMEPVTPRITFISEPENAEIFIDSDYSCKSPSSVFVNKGDHQIRATLKNHRDFYCKLSVNHDDTLYINLISYEVTAIGGTYSINQRYGAEVVFGMGTLFTLGFNTTDNYFVPDNIDYNFDDASSNSLYYLTRTDETFIYKHNKIYFNSGWNIYDNRIYLNVGAGVIMVRKPYVYVTDQDMYLGGRYLSAGQTVAMPFYTGLSGDKGYEMNYYPAFMVGLTADLGIFLISVNYNVDYDVCSYLSAGISYNILRSNSYKTSRSAGNKPAVKNIDNSNYYPNYYYPTNRYYYPRSYRYNVR